MKRQGKRADLTSAENQPKFENTEKSKDKIDMKYMKYIKINLPMIITQVIAWIIIYKSELGMTDGVIAIISVLLGITASMLLVLDD